MALRARLLRRDGFGRADASLLADPRLRWLRELVRPDLLPPLHAE